MSSTDDGPALHQTGCLEVRATPERFPRSPPSVRQVSRPALPRQHRHAYAAGLQRGLPTGALTRLRSRPRASRWRALHPAHIHQIGAGTTITGLQTLIPLVRLLVSLAGPAPSGSASTSRLCQGRSHPSARLRGRAALSFFGLLRQAGDRGLSPLLGNGGASWRTNAPL
jgi:hypothetical protein